MPSVEGIEGAARFAEEDGVSPMGPFQGCSYIFGSRLLVEGLSGWSER